MARLGKSERKIWKLLLEAANHMASEYGPAKAQDYINEAAKAYGKVPPKLFDTVRRDYAASYSESVKGHDIVVSHIPESRSSLASPKAVYFTKAKADKANWTDKRNLDYITHKAPILSNTKARVRKYKRFADNAPDNTPEYGPTDYAAYLNSESAPREASEGQGRAVSENPVDDTKQTGRLSDGPLKPVETIRVTDKARLTVVVPGKPRKRRSRNVVELAGQTVYVERPALPPAKGKPVTIAGKPVQDYAKATLETAGRSVEIVRKPKRPKRQRPAKA